MIYFLDNGDIISLSVDKGYVSFMVLCGIRHAVITSMSRFKPINLFTPHHMEMIIMLMESQNRGDRNIGLTILQQTLNLNINGELVK